jgi:putative ABC transport system permease protein
VSTPKEGGGWRPALRIARRSMRRHVGRSVLIAALIAVPIAGATVMDGLLQTKTTGEHRAYSTMGDADATVEVSDRDSLPGWQPGDYPEPTEDPGRDPWSVDVASMLPPGSRLVPDRSATPLRLTEGDRIVRTQLNLIAVGDPLTSHQSRLVSGRLPAGPDEALVTEPLAERLGLLDGDEVRDGAKIVADGGPTVEVTGLAVSPQSINLDTVMAKPDSVLASVPAVADEASYMTPQFLVDLPEGTDADAVWPALAERGVGLTPRAAYTDPDRYPMMWGQSGEVLETVGPVVLVVAFGLVEVVLLAGAAFAVGARRQVRELGLIAANGGTVRHVRRTVLAQGLCLGVFGAVGGLVLGGAVLFGGWRLWELATGELIDGWRFGWIELTAAAVVGVLSGLAAALLPAIGMGRMAPVDALAQRFRTTALGARLPVVGLVVLGLGTVGVIGFGLLGRARIADYLARQPESDVYIQPDIALPAIGVLVTGIMAVVGLIMSTSGLVAALARLAGRLPLSGRLAVRDAGRHRHRTVPAIAAIMIVVAGSVTMAFAFAGSVASAVKNHPDNTLIVHADPALDRPDGDAAGTDKGGRQLADGADEMVGKLPGAQALELGHLVDADRSTVLVGGSSERSTCVSNEVTVATPEVIALTTGARPDAGMWAALDEGKALVLDECLIEDGEAQAQLSRDDETVGLPAQHVERPAGTYYWDLPGAFVSERTAAEHGWTTKVDRIAVTYAASADQDSIDGALTAAEDFGLDVWQPDDSSEEIDLVNLAIAAGAGLVTLLGVGITVALSAAEGRADLATLAAIGAQPRRRRTLAGAQAFVLSGLGAVLGVLLGSLLAFAVVPLTGMERFAVPWQNIGIMVVAVPLLAVVVAMVFTRARLPMVRRVD